MSSAPAAEEIAQDARWLLQALDPAAGMVRLVAMDRESYRSASFLDDRLFDQPLDQHIVPWGLAASAASLVGRRDARWMFHIGHVGSTLVARLLGELPGVLSVREPRFLRDITTIAADRREPFAAAAQALYSRSFAADESALVKATSFVSEIAPELVPGGGRALLMYAAPRRYIASILGGENSVLELHALAPVRAERVAGRVSGLGPAPTDAKLAAIAWACEMTAIEAAADAMADRAVEWADFDAMLEDMPGALARVADFFGFGAEPGTIEAVANGPLTRRYSKALEHDYTPQLRRDVIADAAARNRRAIDDALAMLAAAAEKSPLLERAMRRAGEN